LVGVAVNVTLVPGQIVWFPPVIAMATDGVTLVLPTVTGNDWVVPATSLYVSV